MYYSNPQLQIKTALANSQKDKISLNKNKGQHDHLKQTIVYFNGLKSIQYIGNNDIPEIDENNILVAESEILVANRRIELNQTPKIEGMLLKKSPYQIQGWQQRWAQCSDNRLVYYLPENRNTPFGIIDFNIMTYSLQEIIDQHGNIIEFVLVPNGSTKNFIFKAQNPLDTQKWLNAVKESQKNSEGAKKILNSLNRYPKFWKTDRISNEQLMKIGESGDILLFRGIGINCEIQRKLTGSDYDHAAVLLRQPSGSLYMLEATGYFGVGLCSWKDLINNRWFQLYEKIIVRRLEIDRDFQFLRNFQEFVNENMGQKYQLTPIKQVRIASTNQEINNQINREERTIFCSAMIAALYKKLGILDQKKSTALYWPGSFQSKNRELQMLKGSLYPEQLIDFSDI
ncbi:unnamed protein product [Paramecium primaurelia]|uniref:PH domain-containing protein n=1 Tax=Paramecium primaurelia TaxID=5886 RepID=A0A8S1NNH6_PARPR|nr:unnamed protein product [Paramecium primaurelia]